jgi:hypothetical protein
MTHYALQRSASPQATDAGFPATFSRLRASVVPEKLLNGFPGKRTARNLLKAGRPPAIAWMRTAMRLSVAAAFLVADYTHVAQIIAVLALINLLGAVELQVAKVALETWHSGIDYIASSFAAAREVACTWCDGSGVLPLPEDCDDDNCCTECAGRGRVSVSLRHRLLS